MCRTLFFFLISLVVATSLCFLTPSRCGSHKTLALFRWTLEATNSHPAAVNSCRSLNKHQRTSWTMKARHPGTLSSCFLLGAAPHLISTLLWTTPINSYHSLTKTAHTKRRPCLRTKQDRSICTWTVGAWWWISCPLLKTQCLQSSQNCITMVTLMTKQVWLCFLFFLMQISLASPKQAAWKDTAEEISIKYHHVTLLLTIPYNTRLWWPFLTAGSYHLKLWALTLDTTATCHTLTTTLAFSVTTPTARPLVTCPFTSSLCWLDHSCPLVVWRGSVGEGLQGKKGLPLTAVNTLVAARPTPRAHTSKLTSAPTQVNLLELAWAGSFMRLFDIYQLFCCLLFRRKALPLFMGGLQLEICPLRWADASLPQAHGSKTLWMSALSEGFLSLWPSGSAHEETHLMVAHTNLKVEDLQWFSMTLILTQRSPLNRFIWD